MPSLTSTQPTRGFGVVVYMPRAASVSARCIWMKSASENMSGARLDGLRRKRTARRFDRRVEHGVVVRARHEAGLVGRRREVDTRFEHSMEERIEARDVAARHVGEAGWHLLGEVKAEHA